MKSLYTYIAMVLILIGCSNNDENPTQETPKNLIITSFSPSTAFPGNEVTFIGNNIDPTVIYTVSFNGIEGETTSVTATEIVAIVPQGATSGEIVISYEDVTITAGTIEIIEELDKLYGYFPVEGAGCEAFYIFSLDINTGALLEEQTLLQAYNCYWEGPSSFYREANIFTHTYWEYLAQGLDPAKRAVIKNFNTGDVHHLSLEYEPDITMSILAAHDNKLFYSYRNYIDTDEAYEIRVVNLATGSTQIIYEFPLDFTYNFKNSWFLPSTNELVFFTKNEVDQPLFLRVNVDTFTLNSTNISDTYSSIFITKTERIFGVKSLGGDEHEIVEIDKASGNILSSLATITAREVQNIDYSLSSNRIFALLRATNYDQYLYILNLNDGTSTTTLLNEQGEHKDFYGIYLNN